MPSAGSGTLGEDEEGRVEIGARATAGSAPQKVR